MTPGSWQWGLWFDACVAAVIGIVAATVAFGYVSAHYAPNTGDDDTFRSVSAMVAPYREDLLAPCIKRFGFMADADALVALPQWRAFITRKTEIFPCGALSGVAIVPAAYNFELHRNLHRAISSVFRLAGPRLVGFAWYQAIQYGIVLALLFGIFRLGMGRTVSALMMVPLLVSPRHLEMALAPIEYAKAPFFAACLLGVGLLVSVRMPALVAYWVAAATGVAVGIGFGFKPDVLVFAPFGLIALAAFFRSAPNSADGRRALVIGAYVTGVAVAGAPLIQTHFFGSRRSLLPIQVFGGMAPGFTQEYANPPIYDYGVMFDDDYVIAAINSYNQRVNGSTEFGAFYTETIHRGATDLVLRLQSTFVADILLRTYAAILQVFQFIPGGALAAAVVLIWLCRVDARLAFFVVFTLAYMVGYTSLVFAPKHYFHLEFVPWWFAGCIVGGVGAAVGRSIKRSPPRDSSENLSRRSWATVFAMVAAALAVGASALALARVYQDRQVRLMLTRYTQGDRFERLAIRSLATPASATLVIPEKVSGEDGDPLAPAAGASEPVFLSPRVEADYLALRVQCVGNGSADIVAVYRRPAYWRDSWTVPCERPDQAWTVMWPVYQHLPHQVFEGFEYPGPALLRVNGISRVKNLDGYQFLLRLRLPDDWTQRPLHHTLNLTTVSPGRVRPVPVAPSSPPPLPPPAVSWDPPFVARLTSLSTQAPRLDSWTMLEGVSVKPAGGRFLVQGNSSTFGYQLSSPAIAVPPHSRIVVRVFGAVEAGRVSIGVLDREGSRWLMPPVWGRSDFVANTGANERVYLVFANARQPADETVATQFFVDSITYDVQSSALARIRTLLWPVSQ